MSAAIQFPALNHFLACAGAEPAAAATPPTPNLAFYRKYTERILRRYLLASTLVGRRPTVFTEPLLRGRASHRVVKTFEDCVIFVLDMQKCLDRLSALDRELIHRIVLQEYSEAETALLLDRSERNVRNRIAGALDHLTEILLDCGTLRPPHLGSPCPEFD